MKCAFIYNPNSGKGYIKKKLEKIVSTLKTKYDEILIMPTQYEKHAQDLADSICKNNALSDDKISTLVVAGGDGTINEVVSGIAKNSREDRPTLGLIPCGTVNDLAHSLKIPKNLSKRLKIILKGNTIDHDYFKINEDKYGIYVCCTGLFTQQSYSTKQKKKKFLGRLAYAVDAIKSIKNQKPVEVEFKTGELRENCKCSLVMAINSKSVAGLKFNRGAVETDGLVDFVMLPCDDKLKFGDLLKVAKLFVLGINWAKKSKRAVYLKVDNFSINVNQTMNIDGEKLNEQNIKFETIKPGIKFYVK